jgi:hypothetical protein
LVELSTAVSEGLGDGVNVEVDVTSAVSVGLCDGLNVEVGVTSAVSVGLSEAVKVAVGVPCGQVSSVIWLPPSMVIAPLELPPFDRMPPRVSAPAPRVMANSDMIVPWKLLVAPRVAPAAPSTTQNTFWAWAWPVSVTTKSAWVVKPPTIRKMKTASGLFPPSSVRGVASVVAPADPKIL